MTPQQALDAAKESGDFCRPLSWRTTARAYRYCTLDCTWIALDFAPSGGALAFSGRSVCGGPAVNGEDWETLPSELLRIEGERLLRGGRRG